MSKLQLPEGIFPGTAIGMPNPNPRYSGLQKCLIWKVLVFICKRKLHVAVERLELTFTHFFMQVLSLKVVNHDSNECGFKPKNVHIFSQTENAFSVDSGHVNLTLYNRIYTWYKMFACTGVSVEPLDER